jgi:EmrB/QacA subfamily drug resistance transporter
VSGVLAAGGPRPPVADAAQRLHRGVFAVTAAGGLLVSLDVSVANALMPAIGADFEGDGRAAVSWVITAYAIVFAATLVPAGRIADRAGRRRTYLGGLALIGLGSVVCGVAPDLGVLLAGRALQGLGAAAASPASLGLLLAAVGEGRRATYAARWTGAAALGMTLGPFVGGALTTLGDWRWAFLVNVPIVAAVAFAVPRVLPETPRHPGRRLPDPFGAVVLTLAAAAVTLGLSEAGDWGFGSARTTASLAAGLALALLFVRRSGRVADPLLDLGLLRRRRVAVAAAMTFLYAAALFAVLLSFLLFFVDHWGLDLVQAGASVVPMGLVVVLLTTRVGRLADLVGYRTPLTVGAGLMAAGLVLSAATLSGDHFEIGWLPLAVLIGVGVGLCYPLLAAAAVHGLATADLAAASALNQSARQLGAALGVATAVGVLGSAAAPSLGRYHAVWLLAAAFSAVAAAVALLIPDGAAAASDPDPSPTRHRRTTEEYSA